MKKIALITLLLLGMICPQLALAHEETMTRSTSGTNASGSGDGGGDADFGGGDGN